MKRSLSWMLLLVCASCSGPVEVPEAEAPTIDAVRAVAPMCGIYVLDSPAGDHRDGNLRDASFVDGYVLRLTWRDIEPSAGVYDFAAIDHVLAEVDALGQKLSLLFSNAEGDAEPAYVIERAGATWMFTDRNTNHDTYGMTFQRPVPWDAYARGRFAAVLQALAEHRVARGTSMVRLADHPALAALNFGVLGIGAIRDLDVETPISSFPGYSRAALRAAVATSLTAQTSRFPSTAVYVGLWSVADATASPALWQDLVDDLAAMVPKVGVWQENLASNATAFFPSTTFAAPLAAAAGRTPVTFQALTSWARPFTGADKVAGGSPVDAMAWARTTYGARYFEVYAPDVDAALAGDAAWTPSELDAMSTSLCGDS